MLTIPIYKVIEDAEVEEYWRYDAKRIEGKPKKIGNHYYRFDYKGKAGVYNSSYAQIKVAINPVKLTIIPELKEDIVFLEGETVQDVLAQTDYKVFRDGEEMEIDR